MLADMITMVRLLNVSTSITNNTWIIDSTVIKHMTCDFRQINTLKPSTKIVVSIANGNVALIVIYPFGCRQNEL